MKIKKIQKNFKKFRQNQKNNCPYIVNDKIFVFLIYRVGGEVY